MASAAADHPASWPRVAVIVVNWNGWRHTIECLESLRRMTYPSFEVIVVDNGSSDGSVDYIKAWARYEANHGVEHPVRYWERVTASA